MTLTKTVSFKIT